MSGRDFRKYMFVFSAVSSSIIAGAWIYVYFAQMAFMESGFPAWAAKQKLLDSCDLGSVEFIGDSKIEAGIIPKLLPFRATNIGLAGATPIEMRVASKRSLMCRLKPKQIVISVTPEHFGKVSTYFWTLSLRYGFFDGKDLFSVERLAYKLGDSNTFSVKTPEGLSGWVRDWLYETRFPSLSFGSLIAGRLFGRYDSNMSRYKLVLAEGGHVDYGSNEKQNPIPRIQPVQFQPTSLQTIALQQTIRALHENGIIVSILIMPFPEGSAPDSLFVDNFSEYLKHLAPGINDFNLLDAEIPIWPDTLFVDGSHLSSEGARLFTTRLSECVTGGIIQSSCDLSWRRQ